MSRVSAGGDFTQDPGSGGSGQLQYTLTITESGSTACTVAVPLHLTFLGARHKVLPTDASFTPVSRYVVTLAPGQFAQDVATFHEYTPSPLGPCPLSLNGLRMGIGRATVRAAIDPTFVCRHSPVRFGRLQAVAPAPDCTPAVLRASFSIATPENPSTGDYRLVLRDAAGPCRLDSIVGLRLATAAGRPLQTRVFVGVSSPLVIRRGRPLEAIASVDPTGRFCTAPAGLVTITPVRGGPSLSVPVRPAVAACDHGLMTLTSLFHL